MKLYEKCNWLFNNETFIVKYLNKLLKYSYQFDFNEDYTHADIYIKLGFLPLYFTKFLMDWTLRVTPDRNKMIRDT